MSELTVTNEEAQVLLDSAMTTEEKQQRDSSELAIQVAGMEIHERRIVIGKHLLEIYNDRLFRGDEGGQTWADYLANVTPKLTPDGDGFKVDTANRLICLGWSRLSHAPGRDSLGRRQLHTLLDCSPVQVRTALAGTLTFFRLRNLTTRTSMWCAGLGRGFQHR